MAVNREDAGAADRYRLEQSAGALAYDVDLVVVCGPDYKPFCVMAKLPPAGFWPSVKEPVW